MKEITTIQRFSVAPTNIRETKANIFSYHSKQKIEFEKKESFIWEDESYKIELKGFKLNQIHRDIFDIILYYGGKDFDGKLKDYRFVRTISIYKIKELLGYSNSKNQKWIEEKIDEMQHTLIQVYDKTNKEKWKFPVIETAKHSEKLNTYAVIIHPLYYAFFSNSISIDYSFYLKKILNLKNGITKAAIRFFLTHTSGMNINIDNLLKKLKVGGSQRNFEKQRAKLLKELDEIKDYFNLKLIKTTRDNRQKRDYTVSYKRLPKIKIYFPTEKMIVKKNKIVGKQKKN